MLASAEQHEQARVGARRHHAIRQVAVGLATVTRLHQLDADHQPGSADVADPVVLGRDPPQPGARSAPRAAAFSTSRSSRITSRTPVRPRTPPGSAERRAVGALAPALLRQRLDTSAASGSPFAIAFATHTTSGTIPACSNPHISRCGPPGLHLVGDQQDPVLVAQRPKLRRNEAGAGL